MTIKDDLINIIKADDHKIISENVKAIIDEATKELLEVFSADDLITAVEKLITDLPFSIDELSLILNKLHYLYCKYPDGPNAYNISTLVGAIKAKYTLSPDLEKLQIIKSKPIEKFNQYNIFKIEKKSTNALKLAFDDLEKHLTSMVIEDEKINSVVINEINTLAERIKAHIDYPTHFTKMKLNNTLNDIDNAELKQYVNTFIKNVKSCQKLVAPYIRKWKGKLKNFIDVQEKVICDIKSLLNEHIEKCSQYAKKHDSHYKSHNNEKAKRIKGMFDDEIEKANALSDHLYGSILYELNDSISPQEIVNNQKNKLNELTRSKSVKKSSLIGIKAQTESLYNNDKTDYMTKSNLFKKLFNQYLATSEKMVNDDRIIHHKNQLKEFFSQISQKISDFFEDIFGDKSEKKCRFKVTFFNTHTRETIHKTHQGCLKNIEETRNFLAKLK